MSVITTEESPILNKKPALPNSWVRKKLNSFVNSDGSTGEYIATGSDKFRTFHVYQQGNQQAITKRKVIFAILFLSTFAISLN
jgi:hypothetical protein